MNTINPGGLLWFDDDVRRSIQEKIAEAAQRYRERMGYEPTVCQLNPAQASALESGADRAVARPKKAQAAKPAVPPISLRLVPSDLIQPHCFLIGVGEGEEPRPAALPYRDEPEPERATAAVPARASQSYRASRTAVKPARRPVAPATSVEEKPAPQPVKAAAATATKPAATKVAEAKAAAAKKPAVTTPVTAEPTTTKPATIKATATKPKATKPDDSKKTARKTARGQGPAVTQTVPAIAATRTKAARRRAQMVEQPTLIAVVPEPHDAVRQSATRNRPSRLSRTRGKTQQTPASGKTAAALIAMPTPIAPVAPAATKTAPNRRKHATKAAIVEALKLPLIEAPAPRARRTRRHVA